MRAAVVAVGLVVLWSGGAASAASGSSVSVDITDRLQPAAVTVPAGGAVAWRNADDERHRMRTESGPEEFDSGNLAPGETWTETFSVPGEYRYVDARDPDDRAYWGTVTVTGAGAAGASSPGSAGQAPPGAEGGGDPGPISMPDRTFSPGSVTVAVGTTVSWVNDSDRDHTVTADDGSFDSGDLPPGARFSHTFDQAGSYGYFCALHGGMRGTVVVGDGAAGGDAASAQGGGASPAGASAGTTGPTGGVSTPPGAFAATPEDAVVEVRDFSFDPGALEVAAGTTVRWEHVGDAPHTVTGDDGTFDSGFMDAGETFAHTFTEPGSYPYVCALHPQMIGEVAVLAADGEAVAPAPVTAGAEEGDDPAGRAAGTQAGDVAGSPPTAGADPVGALLPGTGLLAAGLLVSASVLVGAWRIERVLRSGVTPDAPPPARRRPGRTGSASRAPES